MTVVARHIGRLGNNMFQIAAAIGYARKYGYEWGVDPNSGVGEPYSSIHQTFPNLPKTNQLNGVRFHEHNNEFCHVHNMHKDLCHFDYHEIPNLGANVLLTGFYQSWKYFEHCKEEIKKVFELPEIYGYENYTSIHFRFGDYVIHSGSFPPITSDYIRAAIERSTSKKFMVFSDDLNLSRLLIGQLSSDFIFEYSEGKSDLEDMYLMASCGNHIIANSSFSWWAAYLGHNPDRIVISPSCVRGNWFGMESGVKKDCVDLLPHEWIQIKFR